MNLLQHILFTGGLLFCTSSAIANFDATIPVIDLNDFHSPTRHDAFIRDLSAALQSCGFVAISNAGVNNTTLDQAYDAAQQFFNLPLITKQRNLAPQTSGQRGYVQSETAKGNSTKDFKEFYHIGRDANIWPTEGSFKPAMQNLIAALDDHVAIIEQALSESIGERPDFFSTMTKNGAYLLRVIHYPANPPADSIWAAAHTDIDLFTILPRATAAGLQVQNAKGEWIDVIVPENAFILNAGDMLQNLTNGVYKSSKHRVVSSDKNIERYSIVAFIHPKATDNVGPLNKFIQQVGQRKFADATQYELLSERLVDLGLNSPAMLRDLAESGLMERLIEVGRASNSAMRALRTANLASPLVIKELNN